MGSNPRLLIFILLVMLAGTAIAQEPFTGTLEGTINGTPVVIEIRDAVIHYPTATPTPTITPTVEPSPTPETLVTYTINVRMNFRDTPGGTKLDVLEVGETGRVIATYQGNVYQWLQVITDAGVTGFLANYSNWISVSGDLASLPAWEPESLSKTRLAPWILGTMSPEKLQRIEDHVLALCPTWTLVMNNSGFAKRLQDRTRAECGSRINVIDRAYSANEGAEFESKTPMEFIQQFCQVGNPDSYYMLTNEPRVSDGNIDDLVSDEHQAMFLARNLELVSPTCAERFPDGMCLALLNMGVGTYPPRWVSDGRFDSILEDMDKGCYVLAPHEYSQWLIQFGIGVYPAEALLDFSIWQPENWITELPVAYVPNADYARFVAELPFTSQTSDQPPENVPYGLWRVYQSYRDANLGEFSAEAAGFTAQGACGVLPGHWHIRRADWFLLRADCIGVERPRIVIGEGFHDYMGDIQQVIEDPRILQYDTPLLGTLRGFRDLRNIWAAAWSHWTFEQATVEQWLWADEIYTEDYEGLIIFAANDNGWEMFNILQEPGVMAELERRVN